MTITQPELSRPLPYACDTFTGIRASDSRLTVANYIGGISPIVTAQGEQSSAEHERPLLFIADMHAFTDQDPRSIAENRVSILETYLALGVNPESTDIFVQSQIAPQVLRMTAALGRFMTINQIERVPTLKDKVTNPKLANMLLAQYPLLMAADIILQRPRVVPTGLDQKAHVEVTRDLVGKINSRATFDLLPEPDTKEQVPVNIQALKGPGKMSKTDPTKAIFLDDSPDEVATKIRKAQTAPTGESSDHLLSLMRIGTDLSAGEAKNDLDALYTEHLAGRPVTSAIKELITGVVVDFTENYQRRRSEIAADPGYVRSAVDAGAARAARTANETLVSLDEHGITLSNYA
jgi:tryptophanyl-tRNA synthetase